VRAVLGLTLVPLVGCSSLLGIKDPTPDDRIDGGIDAQPTDHLMFNVGDFQLAMLQSARVHVVFVHHDGTQENVTTTATYSSNNEPIVKVGGQGVIYSADTQTGSATITASLAGAAPATVKVAVKVSMCHPVINELTTGTTAHGAADEWVEIYNPCTTAIDVTGWTLKYRGPNTISGMDDNLMMTLPGPTSSATMMPGEFRLYAGVGYPGASDGTWTQATGILGQNGGAVGLRDMTSAIVDSVGYDTASTANPFTETRAVPGVVYDSSASRRPFDGKDDGDGASDFVVAMPTPGALNVP
jgi:hypothetical protein